MNKPVTVVEAMKRSDAELVCYVDSDMIFMGEPNLLDLDADTDFAACASDRNIGVTSDEDETTPFWREICRVLEIQFDDLPWVHAHRDGIGIRMYFNAGMFAFRRSSGFAEAYLQSVIDLLDAKVSSKVSNIYFHEQASLGLTAFKLKLRWKALPHVYNYAVGGKIMSRYEPQKVQQGIILHYHDMMWPNNWAMLMKHLATDRPDVHSWLEGLGPLQLNGSAVQKLTSRFLNARRKRKQNQHISQCRVV
jgi:lipopolysaccharide biosynthesis glycosyltransferase